MELAKASTPGAGRGALQETRNRSRSLSEEKAQAAQTGLGQRRRPQLRRALGRCGLSFADEPCLKRAELCSHE